ncbi:MAG: TonB-dependent receptor [Calditrichaceae bacterium]
MKTQYIFLIPLIFVLVAYADVQKGKIGGQILDKGSQQPLAGANVLITGSKRGASTDVDGHFIITDLKPGSYNIEVHYLGYATLKKSNIIVNPNRTTILSLALTEDYVEGDIIEVSAGYFEKAREAIVSTRSMDFEEIRRSPGDLVDIQRAVQALPAVVTGSDQVNEIIIRGGYPGENLFIMDNIDIPNPNHFAIQGAGGGQINLLNSYMVRSLDFYAGAFSAKYGDKASSVLEIYNRNGSRDRFRGEGSFGMAGAGILVEGPINSKSSFIISARKSFLDWLITSLELTAVPEYYSFQGKLTYDLNKKNRLLINAVYGNDDIKIEDTDEAGFGRGAENLSTKNDQLILGATLNTFWQKNLLSNTTLSVVKNKFYVDVYEKSFQKKNTIYISDALETEYTLKSDNIYQLNKWSELTFGASWKNVVYDYYNKLDSDTLFYYQNQIKTDSIFTIYPEKIDDIKLNSYKTAMYAQLSIDLLNKFRVTGGLRHHYFDYTGFSAVSPRIGISYFINPKSTFNVAYGKHYQSPGSIELVSNSINKNLKSKYTQQYVISFEHLLRDDIKIVLETYYKTYSNVPINKTYTTTDPFDYDDGTYLNAVEARSKGFEVFVQKKLTNKFSTLLSYAHSNSEAKDPRTNKFYNWDYDYRNVLTFISGYKFSFMDKKWYQNIKNKWWFYSVSWLPIFPADEFELSFKFRYLGGRPYTPPVYYPDLQEWVIEESQYLNAKRYPDYHRLDIRIDRRIVFDNWNFVIFFDLNNIYNRDNIWAYQYGVDDDGEKSIKKVLQYKTLPIGGFSIEF